MKFSYSFKEQTTKETIVRNDPIQTTELKEASNTTTYVRLLNLCCANAS